MLRPITLTHTNQIVPYKEYKIQAIVISDKFFHDSFKSIIHLNTVRINNILLKYFNLGDVKWQLLDN